jgi:hypothetical protein
MFAFTSTMNLVAMTDERRASGHPAEQHGMMAEALGVLAAERPVLGGIRGLAANMTADSGLDDAFDYVLARVLDGLDMRLEQLGSRPGGA